jgi:hypothetical protein
MLVSYLFLFLFHAGSFRFVSAKSERSEKGVCADTEPGGMK